MTLFELLAKFPDDETCRQYLIQIRWPNGVRCPRCECDRVSALPKRKQWTCLACRYRFSAISGTIFENSKLTLRKWFAAILLLIVSKKSQSSLQVNRQLGISQECCWHMCHRLREAMREGEADRVKFTGTVQADEVYVGGAPRSPNKHQKHVFGKPRKRRATGRGTDKQPVLGAVHPETGKVRTAPVDNLTAEQFSEHLEEWCDPSQTDLHTDQFRSYRKAAKPFRSHEVVNHSVEYVRFDGVNTNSIESAWSLFDRAVCGSFHHISVKHLPMYLAEFDSRFNTRDIAPEVYFDVILRRSIGRRLSHRELVG